MFGIGGKRGEGAKKAVPKARPYITYRITPSNYQTLSEEERIKKLTAFVSLIAGIEKHLRIVITKRPVALDEAYGSAANYIEKAIYFTSRQDVGPLLADCGIRGTRMDRPYGFEIESEASGHVVLAGGSLARAYTVYNMPKTISAAWIGMLARISGTVVVEMRPVPNSRAARMLSGHANMMAQRGGRHAEEAATAAGVRDMIQKEETSMVNVGVTAIVYARDPGELRKVSREFRRGADRSSIRCIAIPGTQGRMFGGWGHRFDFERGSCAAFYPYDSSDLIEGDGAGGVYIGVNRMTGAPVIYDYMRRTNANIFAVGRSGQGKSMTAKTYIDNFLRMIGKKYGADQRVMLAIVDPHGEYSGLADRWGARVVDLDKRQPIGNPFRFYDRPDMALSILVQASEMPARERSLAQSVTSGCGSVEDLVEKLNSDGSPNAEVAHNAAAYLMQYMTGGISEMFKGRPVEGDRIIYRMRQADKTPTNAMIISMAMGKVWRDMRAAPRSVPKLFVIDEGWFVVSMDASGRVLDDIARSGRKENVHLLFLTQDARDVVENVHGKTVLNNSSTKWLMGLAANQAASLQEALDLSDAETSEIERLGTGHMIMHADDTRIKVYASPTEEQMAAFKTSPAGIGDGTQ